MNKKIIIKFHNRINEDLITNLITSILKDLANKRLFFFLDDVLKDDYNYYFVVSGNIKKYNFLIKNINHYIKINDFLLTT